MRAVGRSGSRFGQLLAEASEPSTPQKPLISAEVFAEASNSNNINAKPQRNQLIIALLCEASA
jgi:hypothetical protein